jgi:hypothetical protein
VHETIKQYFLLNVRDILQRNGMFSNQKSNCDPSVLDIKELTYVVTLYFKFILRLLLKPVLCFHLSRKVLFFSGYIIISFLW